MKPYLQTKDHSVSKEEFELRLDANLDMLVTHPQPENLERYYESSAYISHTDATDSFVDKLYQRVKRYSLSKKLGLITDFANGQKSLLDFGAGTGDFLARAQKDAWQINGVEPNEAARKKAAQKGVDLVDSLSNLKQEKFQVITLWHVLEHLPNLDQDIAVLISRLAENGTLIIAVPNYKSYDAKYYKSFWAAFDVPRHLWHFSKSSIQKLFEGHGMKLVETKPMIFDAFYVSLLSEKYKSGNQNFLSAMCIGLWSNISAWRTKEYSSHIYILQKA